MVSSPTITLRDAPPRVVWALEQAGVHPLLARLFAGRGVRDGDELDDGLARLLSPAGLLGAQAAALFLADAIVAHKRICIVADYDCDGATACAVAMRGLRLLGATDGTLHCVVPDRAVHGYGLTPAIVELALLKQPDVIVTVDNGIASQQGVAFARAKGVDVIVTDHHLPALVEDRVVLPEANVIVNPNQPGCNFASKNLAGVGVMTTCCSRCVACNASAGCSRPKRSRGSTRCSTWSRWAPSPMWSNSTPTTAAWSRKA